MSDKEDIPFAADLIPNPVDHYHNEESTPADEEGPKPVVLFPHSLFPYHKPIEPFTRMRYYSGSSARTSAIL